MKRILFTFIGVVLATLIYAQPLDQLIDQALEAQPQLRALDYDYEALESAKQLETSWAPPEVSMGIGAFPVETRVGPQVFKVGLNQKLPYRGAQKARQAVHQYDQQQILSQRASTSLNLRFQVQSEYHKLYILQQKEKVLLRALEILSEQRKERIRQMESGSGKYSAVLVIERSEEQYREQLRQIENDREVIYSAISYWVGSDSVEVIEVSTPFPEIASLESIPVQNSVAQHPDILWYDQEFQNLKAQQKVAKWENYPKIAVGVDYIWNAQRQNVELPDNGRDALIPMIGISLPFLTSTYSKKKELLQSRAVAAEWRKENERQRLVSEKYQAMERLKKAQSQYQFLQSQIEKTQSIASMVAREISSSTATFFDYWELEEATINYQLKQLEAAQAAQRELFLIQKYNNQ
jgi:outer membrane protein TolC